MMDKVNNKKNFSLLSLPGPEPERLEKKDLPEVGGQQGLEPTRYGDWEHKGRCSDF